MAEPPQTQGVPSPISKLLQTLGMTREDLVLHTEQMRAHLSQDDPPALEEPTPTTAHAVRRSRTASLPKLALPRSPSPPRTPVKPEPVDAVLPPRQMDTMQLIMERKRKQGKREQKEVSPQPRDTRRVFATNTATPSRVDSPQLSPQTPHHYKYYSERVIGEASSSQVSLDSPEGSVSLPRTPSRPSGQLRGPSSRTRLLKTPVSRHIYSHASSSRASTPCSSPAQIVNIVSSPGPARTDPNEEEDEPDEEPALPYTLPPGPYSTIKPDYSYAALIGQAVLSSPEHRLTLQDIYEWITTVYPFYNRGEQTWMNSVRHSLSTMAVFRKVPRGRNEGKSLWAIWDCDIPCFANGGFRKSLCADMVKNKPPPAKSGPKRKTMEETMAARETKRRKKSNKNDVDTDRSSAIPPLFNAPILPPFYTPVYPNAQQQPYYTNYVAQPLPADVIFPPLPAHSAYHHHRMASANASRTPSVDRTPVASTSAAPPYVKGEHDISSATLLYPEDEPSSTKNSPKAPSSSSSGSSLSIPALTPNCSSSSASSPPLSSEPSLSSIDDDASDLTLPTVPAPTLDDDEVDRLTAQWLASPSVIEAFAGPSPNHPSDNSSAKRKNLRRAPFTFAQSPTPKARVVVSKPSTVKRSPSLDLELPPPPARKTRAQLATPPPPPRPCTPPPRKRTTSSTSLHLSAQHTPISHRGLHMSPSTSASLAHYKSNLDPPPPAVFKPGARAPLLLGLGNIDDPSLTLPSPELTRTPSRKRQVHGADRDGSGSGSRNADKYALSPFPPLTPRRLFAAQADADELPFRPSSSSSRAILDPHDPSTLIDEEVQRLGSQAQGDGDSPMGFFGRRSILYESPSLPDPDRWGQYW